MNNVGKINGSCAALALTLALGFALSLAGKPYNGLLFNTHKWVALGAVVAIAFEAARWLRSGNAPAGTAILLAGAALLVIALFASGALLSLGQAGVYGHAHDPPGSVGRTGGRFDAGRCLAGEGLMTYAPHIAAAAGESVAGESSVWRHLYGIGAAAALVQLAAILAYTVVLSARPQTGEH